MKHHHHLPPLLLPPLLLTACLGGGQPQAPGFDTGYPDEEEETAVPNEPRPAFASPANTSTHALSGYFSGTVYPAGADSLRMELTLTPDGRYTLDLTEGSYRQGTIETGTYTLLANLLTLTTSGHAAKKRYFRVEEQCLEPLDDHYQTIEGRLVNPYTHRKQVTIEMPIDPTKETVTPY